MSNKLTRYWQRIATIRYAYIFAALAVFLVLWRLPYYGKVVLDDPYITFRYGSNLLHHGQFTFNLEQWVLATTTPVYALLMTGIELTGLPVPAAATLINLGFEILLLYVLGLFIKQFPLKPWQHNLAYLLAGVLVITNRAMSIASNSGMETPLFVLLNILTLLYTRQRRYLPATVAGSLATLTRPDGIFALIVLGLGVLIQERRLPWREVILSLIIGLPWMLVAQLTYGTFIPNSVLAKDAIVPLWWGTAGYKLSVVFYEPLRYFAIFLLPPLLYGIWQMTRRSNLASGWLLLGFGALHGVYLLLPSNLGFEWYFAPLYITLYLLVALGVVWFMGTASRWTRLTGAITLLGLLLGVGYSSMGNYLSVATINRIWHEGMFPIIADLNAQHPEESLTIQCTNIGILAYYTDDHILDPYGIGSPEVLPYIQQAADLRDMERIVAQQFQPDYIISFGEEVHAGYIEVDRYPTSDIPLVIYQRQI